MHTHQRSIRLSIFTFTALLSAFFTFNSSEGKELGRTQIPSPEQIFLKKRGNQWDSIVKKNGKITVLEKNVSPPQEDGQALTNTDNIYPDYVTIDVGSYPEALAVGDLNGDDRKDVVLTTSSYFPDPENDYHAFIFIQNKQGQLELFKKFPTGGNPQSVDIGDVNGDGKNDIVIGNDGQNIAVFSQSDTGIFSEPVFLSTINSNKIRIGDFNHDGREDVAGIAEHSHSIDIFLQSEENHLIFSQSYPVLNTVYMDLDTGDINEDGLTDIMAVSYPGEIVVLTQNESGIFNEVVYYEAQGVRWLHGGALGDINGDQLSDVVISQHLNSPDAQIQSFLQDVKGMLTPDISYVSYDTPEAVEIANVNDLKINESKDVVVLHGGWMKVGVYLQGPDKRLSAEQLYPAPYAGYYNPHGLVVADINGDKNKDIIAANCNYGLEIHYNALKLNADEIEKTSQK